ncbi:transcriptional regulator [Virgibacillus profundi]|uniref:Transcriptional regulator n=1 Tax=Virgibacillus profundi TaxID=2024555 RepID=A0A2A2IKP1_9BACI|nr:transcriptional regulator [Virgibacillus profundi]PXY55881.1 HTH domain-containing protein [Virgibacillus profundi]
MPIERQNRIKDRIQEKRNIKIAELSQELGVSEMTIHRDIKPLINEGFVVKTFGGITLAGDYQDIASNTKECVICNKDTDERLAYRLILPNNRIEMTCCAHCGLIRHRQLGDEVIQAICHDFFKQTTISASITWYVMNTSVHMGCCQPQALTFEWKEHAEKFVKGFGGEVYSFYEAMEYLYKKMNGSEKHCSKHE